MATKKTTRKASKKLASKKTSSKSGHKPGCELEANISAAADEVEETGRFVPAINYAAHNLGQQLMAAMLAELVDAGVWAKGSDAERRALTDRLTRRIRHEARIGFSEVLTGGVPACLANLSKVVFTGEDIQGTLKIGKHSDRHELSDFAGQDVLVLLINNVEDHLKDIEEMVAASIEAQQQLPLEVVAEQISVPDGMIWCPRCRGYKGEERPAVATGKSSWVDCYVCKGLGFVDKPEEMA